MREFTSEQGNLHLRLVFYGSKICRSLPPSTRIFKSLCRTLTEFSHVFSLDDLNNRQLTIGSSLKATFSNTVFSLGWWTG